MRHLSYGIALLAIGPGLALLTAAGCFPFTDESSNGGGMTSTTATTGTGGSIPCSPTSICEDADQNPCTQETCMNDVCIVTPLTLDKGPGSTECRTIACKNGVLATTIHGGSACGMGLTCTAQGDCSGCTTNEQCGKTDECQTSTCQTGMTCEYMHQPLGTPVVQAKLPGDLPGDCLGTICNGSGEIELYADDKDAPADSAVCIEGHCLNGQPVQTNSAVGKPCAGGVTFCNAFQSCVVCAIDTNCPMGMTCAQDQKECIGCTDGKKNQDETDIDCGGLCGSTCVDGKGCADNGDCKSNLCTSGKCIGCFDGVKNNGELDTDCGGPCALKCKDGTLCSNAADCVHGQCADGVCCNLGCGDTCSACNLPLKEGSCTQLPKGTDDAAPLCSGMMTCDAGSCVSDGGKKHAGQTCSSAGQCFSGVCAGMPLKCD